MIWAESRSTRHDRREELHKDSIQRAAECYRALQMDACDWVTLGTTNTFESLSGSCEWVFICGGQGGRHPPDRSLWYYGFTLAFGLGVVGILFWKRINSALLTLLCGALGWFWLH